MEEFRQIKGFEHYYVSNLGTVMSDRGRRMRKLKPQQDRMGYVHVRLYPTTPEFGRYESGAKRPKLYKVHRLVMSAFEPNETMDTLQVNHIDGNKLNNNLNNLEWCTHKQNSQHAKSLGKFDHGKLKKPVRAVLEDGTTLHFESRLDAAEYFNSHVNYIMYGIHKKHVTSKGKLKGVSFHDDSRSNV